MNQYAQHIGPVESAYAANTMPTIQGIGIGIILLCCLFFCYAGWWDNGLRHNDK